MCSSDLTDMLAALIQMEDQLQLNTMLDRLNDGDRSVLKMFYMEGQSYAQIGRNLGVSINSVGPKLQRAQQRLRRLMENDGQSMANHK